MPLLQDVNSHLVAWKAEGASAGSPGLRPPSHPDVGQGRQLDLNTLCHPRQVAVFLEALVALLLNPKELLRGTFPAHLGPSCARWVSPFP